MQSLACIWMHMRLLSIAGGIVPRLETAINQAEAAMPVTIAFVGKYNKGGENLGPAEKFYQFPFRVWIHIFSSISLCFPLQMSPMCWDCTKLHNVTRTLQGGDAYQSVMAALNHAAVAVTRTPTSFKLAHSQCRSSWWFEDSMWFPRLKPIINQTRAIHLQLCEESWKLLTA